MQLLFDGGDIYTLGSQPGSHVVGNSIHGHGGCEKTNGIYHDDGSAHWTDNGNVVQFQVAPTPCSGSGRDAPAWASMWSSTIHDVHLDGNFADLNHSVNGGTNCSITGTTIFNSSDASSMPAAARAIIAAAGPRAKKQPLKSDEAFDVLVYGATSGGVTAAVAASRHASKPRVGLIVANGGGCGDAASGGDEDHIGGMSSGGLGKTDIGKGAGLIGGVGGEFYSLCAKAYHTTAPPLYDHEPHVAQNAFEALLANSSVVMLRGGHGANVKAATKHKLRITSIELTDGRTVTAKAFVDASYEGDLLASSTSSAAWTVGRESRSKYNESCAGRRPDDFNRGYQFRVRVNPFDENGKPLPLLSPSGPRGQVGAADYRVQAYNFRLCATNDTAAGRRATFPKPDPNSVFARQLTFELGRRIFAGLRPGWQLRPGCPGSDFPCFEKESPPLDPSTGHKRDWNNPFLEPLNSDCVEGCNQSAYPTASVAHRLKIWTLHREYYLALLQFYGSDPAVPASVRAKVGRWGLCADEFPKSGHWPPQLYTRETRRMVGDRVFTQNTAMQSPCWQDLSTGVGDYTFDSHPAQRFACSSVADPRCAGANPPWLPAHANESFAWSEGNVEQAVKDAYEVPMWVVMPPRAEVSNLLVAATPSGSHIGFSSLRMEPQFMVLGHSAGTIAAIYAANSTQHANAAVQDVDPHAVAAELAAEGQVLRAPQCKTDDDASFNVLKYGAVGDGKTLDTAAIQSTITAAAAAGGGVVLLPAPGVYLSAGITVKSNVTLRSANGSTLMGSRRFSDYKKVVVLATTCDPGSCFEYRAHPIIQFSSCLKPVVGTQLACSSWDRVTNASIDGGGTVDGNGDAWWNFEKYYGAAFQRPHTIFAYYTRDIVIRDVTLIRSPWWTVHILASKRVLIDNIVIDAARGLDVYNSSVYPTQNIDGIDISSSQDVTVQNSYLSPTDDCVVIYDLHPNEMHAKNITIQNTTCRTPFSIGNGDPGKREDITDVTFKNCSVIGGLTPNDQRFKPRWWQTALRIKSGRGCNSSLTRIVFTDIVVENVDLVFDIQARYACQNCSGTQNYEDCANSLGVVAGITPIIDGVVFENVRGTAWRSGWLRCLPEAPCTNISFAGIGVKAEHPFICENAERVTGLEQLGWECHHKPALKLDADARLKTDEDLAGVMAGAKPRPAFEAIDSDAVIAPRLLLIRVAAKVLASPIGVWFGVAICGVGVSAIFLGKLDADTTALETLFYGCIAGSFSQFSLPLFSLRRTTRDAGQLNEDAGRWQHEDLGQGGSTAQTLARCSAL